MISLFNCLLQCIFAHFIPLCFMSCIHSAAILPVSDHPGNYLSKILLNLLCSSLSRIRIAVVAAAATNNKLPGACEKPGSTSIRCTAGLSFFQLIILSYSVTVPPVFEKLPFGPPYKSSTHTADFTPVILPPFITSFPPTI